ncbi:MAG: phage tail protein [Bacillota bacterium]
MSEPFLAEIKIISFGFAPKGWAFCNGQQLPINQNQALFSLLGTTYGGNGQTTFALPNLQGRVPIHMGGGNILGQSGGEPVHTLSVNEMPVHTHQVMANGAGADSTGPAGKVWAPSTANPYTAGASPDTALNSAAISPAGGGEPHENMQPYLVLNYVIALQGIFPSRN